MPPKPWQTRAGASRLAQSTADISSLIKSNNIQEQVKAMPPVADKTPAATAAAAAATTTTNPTSSALGSYSSGLGGYGSGYGSSYGGYGGYGGMSSYGGMGGYGSMYGGGMYGGMGGMYGSGMLGSVDGQEKGFIMNTLAALHSFGFLVHSLGEIGKTLEMNIDGIHKFYDSFKNLLSRLKNFAVTSLASFLNRIKMFFVKILNFIKEKLFLMNSKDKSRMNRWLNIFIRVLFLAFVISLYPLILKPKKV